MIVEWGKQAIMDTGVWAENHVQLFDKVLTPGGVAFDVGANIGHHSIAMSKIIGPHGRVLAFEPQETIFKILQMNIYANNCANITPLMAVIGEKPGGIELPKLDYNQINNFGAMCIENTEKPGQTSIAKITLDSLLADPKYGLERVDFIKLDVQTFELFVLQGAVKLLTQYKPAILIEISPYWMKKINNYDYREIYKFLYEHDYIILDDKLNRVHNIPKIEPSEDVKNMEWDILALHKNATLAKNVN